MWTKRNLKTTRKSFGIGCVDYAIVKRFAVWVDVWVGTPVVE